MTSKGIFKLMSFSSKWNLRDIIRNKFRTITGIAGITGCCMLIVCAIGMLNRMNNFIKLQFEELYNFDYKLTLKANLTEDEINELTDLYGNNTSQTLGIEIVDEQGNKESNNMFVYNASNYIRFQNDDNEFIKLENNKGIYVTYKLAELNNYQIGDTIKWHIYGSDTYYESKIVGFNKDPQNQNVTIISIIIGLPLGYYLIDWLFGVCLGDGYDFGVKINPSTYIIASVGTFVVAYIVSKLLAKKINKIDMVTSLKANE